MHKHINSSMMHFFYHLFDLISKLCVCVLFSYDAKEAHEIEEFTMYSGYTNLSITAVFAECLPGTLGKDFLKN
jgi:hypothetical protein